MISVIIPTYNRRDCLDRAIESVMVQTLLPSEIIIIDDGSTDGTQEFIAQRFPSVRYHYQENHGVSAARNKGLGLARFPWIALLDSDDAWMPNKLELQQEALQAEPDKLICHTNEIWYRQGKRVNPMRKHQKFGGWIFEKCLPLCAMSPSSVLIHQDVFAKVGTFDEDLPACEDYDLWLRITAHYPVLYCEQALTVKYGGHADQLSQRYWGMDRFRIQALHKCLDRKTLNPQYRRQALTMLEYKIGVYLQGAKKRNKSTEIEYYEQLLQHHLSYS